VFTEGGKDQVDRDFTIDDFKRKVRTLMVATSVAGRGLDVKDLVLVINYHCPNHLEDYIHRVGRTGRAGRKGTAYTFISPDVRPWFCLSIWWKLMPTCDM
jgi:ATP-dependent RNA helicase DDX46/PRP5